MDKILICLALNSILVILRPSTLGQLKDSSLPSVKVELKYPGEPAYIQEVKTTVYKVGNKSHLYDGKNEINLVRGKGFGCYIITCSASYPVKWATSIPLTELKSQNFCVLPSGARNEASWKYMNSRRLSDSPFDAATTSRIYSIQLLLGMERNRGGLLKCLSIENSLISTHYFFSHHQYRHDKFVTYGPQIFDQTEFRTLEIFWEKQFVFNVDNTLIVPCVADDLDIKPTLKIQSTDSEMKVEFRTTEAGFKTEIIYSPFIGFVLDKPKFEKTRSYEEHQDTFEINTGPYLECTDLSFSFLKHKLFVYSEEQPLSKIQIIESSAQLSENQNGCFLNRNQDKFIFRRNGSKFEEIDEQRHPLKLMYCNTPDECDMLRKCLDFRGKTCYSIRGIIQVGTRSAIWGGVSIEVPHSRGLLRCLDYRGKSGFKPVYDYTFIGLDNRRYIMSEDNIPKSAIIFLAETDPTLYTNVKATFTCQISSFLLVPNIRFGLVYTNKTVILSKTHEINELYDTGDPSDVPNSNFNLGHLWEDITLDIAAEVIGIMCFAPLHNSSQWVNVSRSFVAKDVQKPIINIPSGSTPKIFQLNDTDFSLHCSANGAPQPRITWILPHADMKIETSESNHTVIHLTEIKNENGDSFLQFPPMQPSFEGTYKCIATNEIGNDSFAFLIKFKGSSLGWSEVSGMIFGIIALLVFAAGFLGLWRKYRYAKRQLRNLTDAEINEFKNGNTKIPGNLKGNTVDIRFLPFGMEHVVQPGDLMIENNAVLGEGQFGKVQRGLLNGVAIAVKTTKSGADVTYVKAFLGEIKVMAYLGDHPHIIKFFGAEISHIQERIVHAVLELSPLGNLQQFLRKLQSNTESFVNLVNQDEIVPLSSFPKDTSNVSAAKITTLNLMRWCKQIAAGMNHLATKRVYHGDLAARNVLVFKNNVVKITDFGLSRQLYASASYVRKQKFPMPWRWMALESIRFLEFSIESDVWAFAVTIWEIFSLGVTPYPGLTWTNEFVNNITQGMRMSKPQNCPKNVFDLMLNCWNAEKGKRPSFYEIIKLFEDILKHFGDSQDIQACSKRDVAVAESTL